MSEPDRIYLLDTCVISELVKGRPDRGVVEWVDSQKEHTLYLSILTIGEIHKGIVMLPSQDRRRRRLMEWLQRDVKERFTDRILGITEEVVLRWGEIDGNAEREGRPIPAIDGLIAATALVAGATIVSRNVDHFGGRGVQIYNPWVRRAILDT